MDAKHNKWTVLSALLLCTIVLYAFTRKAADVVTIDLATAIAQGKVFSEMNSNGSYNGRTVQLNLRNNSSTALKIKVRAGTVFKPSNDDEQDLIQLEDEIIVLQPKSQTMTEVTAYCMQASDRCL